MARGLAKTYVMGDVEVHALRDVDLDIYEREFVVLLGPSGSGKSTLLNILGGLDSPTAGRAMWRDHNLVGADDAALTRYRREHVGFVFQFYNPPIQIRSATVQHRRHGGVNGRERVGVKGFSRRRRCERSEHP
jgi:ABC-type lipoprotein export system ATPase subunit